MLEHIPVRLVIQGMSPDLKTVQLELAVPPQREDLIFFEAGDERLPAHLIQDGVPIVFKVEQIYQGVPRDRWRSPYLEVRVIRVTT